MREAISNLAALVAPLSVREFRNLLRMRTPRLVRGNAPDRYEALLDWDGFLQVVLAGDYRPKLLRLTRRNDPLPRRFFRDKHGPKADAIAKIMEAGGSLVFYGLHPYVPTMARLCAAIARETGEHIVGSAIASTGEGGALPSHYDETDLIVLQVEGSKRWLIEDRPVANPVAGMPLVPREPGAGILLDETLEPGDLLFVPAGHRHRCETAGPRSLHLAFLFYPLAIPRVLDLLRRGAIAADADRVPLRFDPSEAPDVEQRLKAQLIARIDRLSLGELLAAHQATELEAPHE